MTTLIVNNLDDAITDQLSINASKHNCSIEEEVQRILKQALLPTAQQKNLGTHLHQQIVKLTTDSEELEIPARSLPRNAPDFS